MSSISRHWKSFESLWWVDLKSAFYKGQTSAPILWDFSQIWSTFYWLFNSMVNFIKESLTRKSTYIELNLSKKVIVIHQRLKPKRTTWKTPKFFKNGQNRDFEPCFQGNNSTYKQTFKCRPQELDKILIPYKVHEKYWQLHEICSKISKIANFCLPLDSNDKV